MNIGPSLRALTGACLALLSSIASADDGCRGPLDRHAISFITFQSPNLAATSPANAMLTIEGKLSLPPVLAAPWRCDAGSHHRKMAAVVILHGSSGVDSRGDFYEAALNAEGIATLQIDMWQARGVTGIANRPAAPILTYPDAYSALAFLAARPDIDPDRIGVLGFSWGGVVSLATAERLYTAEFGGGRKFAAHVANYPVCWGANNTSIPALYPPAEKGTQFLHLTGAPVLIQIGSKDSYDNGTAHCVALADSVNPTNGNVVSVNQYPGATHAWDRLMVPETAPDPFADEGSYFRTGILPTVVITPDVMQAYESRARVARFFKENLSERR
ncbi:MAG: dienelactone hydrolase family protein [Vitreoscilla sp.]